VPSLGFSVAMPFLFDRFIPRIDPDEIVVRMPAPRSFVSRPCGRFFADELKTFGPGNERQAHGKWDWPSGQSHSRLSAMAVAPFAATLRYGAYGAVFTSAAAVWGCAGGVGWAIGDTMACPTETGRYFLPCFTGDSDFRDLRKLKIAHDDFADLALDDLSSHTDHRYRRLAQDHTFQLDRGSGGGGGAAIGSAWTTTGYARAGSRSRSGRSWRRLGRLCYRHGRRGVQIRRRRLERVPSRRRNGRCVLIRAAPHSPRRSRPGPARAPSQPRPRRVVAEVADRHAGRQTRDIIFQPFQLVVPQRAQPARFQVHDVDQADEVHALLLEAVPPRPAGPLWRTLMVLLSVVIQNVVLSGDIENILCRGALQNLLDRCRIPPASKGG